MDIQQYMEEALVEAQNALNRGEVPVGCVFVYDNNIIARQSNRANELYNATKHAEILAIEDIASKYKDDTSAILAKTTLYVTCEPCIMCASMLAQVGIAKVIFGCFNSRFGGCGSMANLNTNSAFPQSIHYKPFPIESGIMQEKAITLLQQFYFTINPRVPNSNKSRKKKEKQLLNAIEQ